MGCGSSSAKSPEDTKPEANNDPPKPAEEKKTDVTEDKLKEEKAAAASEKAAVSEVTDDPASSDKGSPKGTTKPTEGAAEGEEGGKKKKKRTKRRSSSEKTGGLTYEERLEAAKAARPRAEKKRRRSSLMSPALLLAEQKQAYQHPHIKFYEELHFEAGEEVGQIPWTALRRAVLHRWFVTAHIVPGEGLLPIYIERQTHLDHHRENVLRAKLEIPPRDYDFQKPSEVISIKRSRIDDLLKECTVDLVGLPGGNAGGGEYKDRQAVKFSTWFSENCGADEDDE